LPRTELCSGAGFGTRASQNIIIIRGNFLFLYFTTAKLERGYLFSTVQASSATRLHGKINKKIPHHVTETKCGTNRLDSPCPAAYY
jgi:hypothetical protein